MKAFIVSALAFVLGAQAGTTVWSGSFNNYPTPASFDQWSWANQVGAYQWYIHGSQPSSTYLALDPAFKNPALTQELRGLRMTISSTATWNSQMERCELIPQTTANLGTGNLFYHFSIKHDGTSPPESTLEHQIAFFESHFTELKYGVAPNPTNLQWHVGGVAQWGTPFTADTWFNFAYDIDFNAKTVGLWASTGSNPLVKVVANMAAATSTNSADFHVGVLRIVNDAVPENWYFSGVFIESGPITTAIGTGAPPSSAPVSVPPSSAPTSAPPSSVPTSKPTTAPPSSFPTSKPSSAPPSSSSSAPVATQTQYGQCGGTGYTGPTVCASPFTCKAVSPPYYSQCL